MLVNYYFEKVEKGRLGYTFVLDGNQYKGEIKESFGM
jgi:hypothetical protein